MGEDIVRWIGEKVKSIPRQFFLPLLLLCIGLIFFLYGLIQIIHPRKSDTLSVETMPTSILTPSATPHTEIVVDVEGAVFHPGVYHLLSTSRIQDALVAAGGLSSQADRVLVGKQLNMATKLVDGMKVYVPLQGAEPTLSLFGTPPSSVVHINSASLQELDNLQGIGPATANKIIAGRPYTDISDLIKRKIVSQKVYDLIKDKIEL